MGKENTTPAKDVVLLKLEPSKDKWIVLKITPNSNGEIQSPRDHRHNEMEEFLKKSFNKNDGSTDTTFKIEGRLVYAHK